MRPSVAAMVWVALACPRALWSQTTLLSAVEGSVPPGGLERIAGVDRKSVVVGKRVDHGGRRMI